MVKVKSQAQIQANYSGAAGVAAQRYRDSIGTVVWRAPAEAGQTLYETQMQTLEILRRRLRGVQKVSDAQIQEAMKIKGAPVIQSRMTAAAQKMAANFAPYRTALEGVTLPARTADPMTNIDQRLKPIVQAMIDTKRQLEGGAA